MYLERVNLNPSEKIECAVSFVANVAMHGQSLDAVFGNRRCRCRSGLRIKINAGDGSSGLAYGGGMLMGIAPAGDEDLVWYIGAGEDGCEGYE